ncbi:type I polyketide synthase [Mycolicibacterium litorale]|uniref:type I polyketide synthase n=1 Tax=Mycolicibacterium litorale TaxID=758802 RepID=UPI003CF498A7
MTRNLDLQSEALPDNAIAVVGMAGRFPGADSVSAFWRNLRRGEESIVTLSEEELLASGIGEHALANHSYVRRAALLSGIDEFDADFFGFTPQAARMMDPQHRLFLQSAWHALEDAGYDPMRIEGAVGVYGTSSASGYLLHNLMSHHDPKVIIGQGATFDMVSLSLQNDKDHLATRVAHQLNLRGPALSVQTACSSSLVAVHLACQSILAGECDMALAGGASVRVPHRVGYWHEPGSMVSATGHCRPFDLRSDGTIFGSGVGVVVLKPLQAAVDDGDRIHAVIRGSAINNDGSSKMNYAAPNATGQAEAIAEAHAVADIDASTVSYIESHGTGTPLGDPVEIEGLRQAFGLSTAPRTGPCFVGSVKSNIGHLEAASGIAGLIKAILCLEHRALPATLHFTGPNPALHLEQGPFVVRDEYGTWDWDGPRRAGVSSFGVGGTNCHVVLEEAPAFSTSDTDPGPQVLMLSARSAEALQDSRSAVAAELREADEISLADAAYTLATRRQEPIRMVAVVRDRAHAASVLAGEDEDVFIGEAARPDEPGTERVVFAFPGQGAQHIGMAHGLYQSEPEFAAHFDRCATAFAAESGLDLHSEVFNGSGRSLERTDHAQPALFSVEYALAKLTESYGVRPAVVAGHSIGEYVAATIAGVFDLETAAKAVSMRARLMHASPRGVMVAVALSPDAIAEHLVPDVDLAAVNDPGNCVVAGSAEAVERFQARLAEHGIVARRVRTSHAFHSRLMDSVIPEFKAFMSRLVLREPRIPMLSNVTGTWMSAAEATNPATWARQIRETVRFSDELDVLLTDPSRVLVEVGPGGSLTSSALRHPKWSDRHRAVRLMRHHAQNRGDHDAFLLGLGQLWSAGIDVDWSPRTAGRRPRLVSMPGYPFERQRHWVDHLATARWHDSAEAADGAAVAPSTPARNGAQAAVNGKSQMETTLQRIWSQCLGVDRIDRNANFFELGGDSLVAISVAMTAANEGFDLTPQDLYENQTVSALAATLVARLAAGGLARPSPDDAVNPPVPPNIEHFLEHGLRDANRWRIPVILRLRPDVGAEHAQAVLTALTNHHDALRLRIEQRAGTWEQHFLDPQDFGELPVRELPEGLPPGSPQERDAVLDILEEQACGPEMWGSPLTAVYIHGQSAGPCYLAMSVHGIVGDHASRDILLTDIFTAFAQRLAGEEIALQPVTASWREWSQRCAGLATHPAVVDSRGFWLDTATTATLRVAGDRGDRRPESGELARVPSALTVAQTMEIDDARRTCKVSLDELLLAALSRAVANVVGEGVLAVDLAGAGRSVLKPEVDLRRTVGGFTTIYPVALACAMRREAGAGQLLSEVRDTLKAVPHHGIGYGLLRYTYAPTARLLGATRPADIFLSHIGTIPDAPPASSGDEPVQFDADTALPVRIATPGLGHALEVRVYRSAGVLHIDWWIDTRRIEPAFGKSLAARFSTALVELSAEAVAEQESETANDELVLVDLSSTD